MAYIEGTKGYEYIEGTGGYDTIDSKGGNDRMRDYWGNETYIFNYGYGQPTITDAQGNDTISFGAGISAQDLKFYKSSFGSLMIRVNNTTDKPEIMNWFLDPKYKIETLKFEDGTTLSASYIDSKIENTRVLVGTSENDSIKVGQGNNLIYLMQGNDIFTSTGGNNIIEASSGNDLIYNYGNGTDEIYMGTGTDYAEDWSGDDRYIYNPGDGQDTILDKTGNDTVKFGIGIIKSNLIFNKTGDDLVVTFTNKSTDKLTIKDWGKSPDNRIETFELWDNSTITAQQINSQIGINTPDPQQNITPTVIGTDGYDYFKGYNGNDVYYLKKGNDRVMDYVGNDTYLFNIGDGQDSITDNNGSDTIIFGNGITKNNITLTRDNSNVVMSLNNSTDKITIVDWYRNNNYKIENIYFSDGTKLTSTDIENIINPAIVKPINIAGTDGDDNLTGNDLDNTYQAGKGNDTITDPSGNDIYQFNKDDGQDIITDNGGVDNIKFGTGISKTDLDFSKDGNNMVIKITSTNDKVTIQNWYSSLQNKIETFAFTDSSTSFLTSADAERKAMDNWTAYGYNPSIIGTDGYDYFKGYNGNDVYYLKKGNDRVMDYVGNDTYLFNIGDGQDNITDNNGSDTIIFGDGITKDNITLTRNNNNIVMSVNNSTDKITIIDWYRNNNYQIEKVQFVDNSYFTNNDINQIIQQMATFNSSNSQTTTLDTSGQNQQNITLVPTS